MSTWSFIAVIAVLVIGFGVVALSVYSKTSQTNAQVAVLQANAARDAAIHVADQNAAAAHEAHKNDIFNGITGLIGNVLGGIF